MTKPLDRRSMLRVSALTGLVGAAGVGTVAPALADPRRPDGAGPDGNSPDGTGRDGTGTNRLRRIPGLWEATLVIQEQQRRELALWNLSEDGMFLHTGDNGGTGFGRWERSGLSTFTVTFREFVLTAEGALEGQLRIRETCTFTGADTIEVSSVARFFTPEGSLLGTFHATGTGSRVND
ncbi:hypothetical protein FHS29_004050 [Saccharothrix tamanrassetensis]|uniref:DUF1579 domain-containing protein n=1 Tax=Saccharothrix tamanrassetensis TaxID=1051531 RepID=A0A841CN89_9PSEU|nr:hypothetical protein [Saccharothrix tamanrassetensis]MBB5957455.1 hypothetical protein [Saccharothrix tamanrassetensis]